MTLSDTFFKYYINFNFYIMGNSNSTKSDVGDALKSTIPAIAGTYLIRNNRLSIICFIFVVK